MMKVYPFIAPLRLDSQHAGTKTGSGLVLPGHQVTVEEKNNCQKEKEAADGEDEEGEEGELWKLR